MAAQTAREAAGTQGAGIRSGRAAGACPEVQQPDVHGELEDSTYKQVTASVYEPQWKLHDRGTWEPQPQGATLCGCS